MIRDSGGFYKKRLKFQHRRARVLLSGTGPTFPRMDCISWVMTDDADDYRKQAELCRVQAAKSISPDDRDSWLRMAAEYLKLALSADGRSRE
jgi:hypothetical protein